MKPHLEHQQKRAHESITKEQMKGMEPRWNERLLKQEAREQQIL